MKMECPKIQLCSRLYSRRSLTVFAFSWVKHPNPPSLGGQLRRMLSTHLPCDSRLADSPYNFITGLANWQTTKIDRNWLRRLQQSPESWRPLASGHHLVRQASHRDAHCHCCLGDRENWRHYGGKENVAFRMLAGRVATVTFLCTRCLQEKHFTFSVHFFCENHGTFYKAMPMSGML